MAFIEPMHRNKPNITYLLTHKFPAMNIHQHVASVHSMQ